MSPMQAVQAYEKAQGEVIAAALCFVRALESAIDDDVTGPITVVEESRIRATVTLEFARQVVTSVKVLEAAGEAMRASVGGVVL